MKVYLLYYQQDGEEQVVIEAYTNRASADDARIEMAACHDSNYHTYWVKEMDLID